MNFLRLLKMFNLPKAMMVHFYTAIVESILTCSIIIWYAASTAKDKQTAAYHQRVIGCNLPLLQDLVSRGDYG